MVGFQSTHPVWDGTQRALQQLAIEDHFNPPIPCGMGRSFMFSAYVNVIFQSTHPVWDGTNHPEPRGKIERDFNPPIPCGMGLDYPGSLQDIGYISIHPSRVGWDNCFATSKGAAYISIHPSRVGWDTATRRWRRMINHFNPPIPCGMGQRGEGAAPAASPFQSTHPVWDGTTSERRRFFTIKYFNPPIPCGMGHHRI